MLSDLQRLKLHLMTEGLVVSEDARARLTEEEDRPLTLAEYATTSGVSVHLGEDIWVNAPLREFNPNFVHDPIARLDSQDDRYMVRRGDLETEVEIVTVPAYHDQANDSDEPYASYAATHTDRVRISPIEGCSMACSFCDLPYEFRYRRKRIDGLLESVQVALDDPLVPARHILISGGTPKPEDYDYLNSVYRTVAERFPDVAVDVMMVPAPGLLDPKELLEMGIAGLSINIELFGDEAMKKIMPVKARMGSAYYLDFIADAVEVFGSGRVRSLILVGLEPLEDTLRGVEELARRGCEPVLSPFRPDPRTPLRDAPPPNAELLEHCYLESLRIVAKQSTQLGPRCIPCQHNTLTFPDDSGYYHYT